MREKTPSKMTKMLFIQLVIIRIRRRDVDLTCICASGASIYVYNAFQLVDESERIFFYI